MAFWVCVLLPLSAHISQLTPTGAGGYGSGVRSLFYLSAFVKLTRGSNLVTSPR